MLKEQFIIKDKEIELKPIIKDKKEVIKKLLKNTNKSYKLTHSKNNFLINE